MTIIETYPQLIGYDPEVFEYFKEQQHLCGFDLNLTYPQGGHFPTLNLTLPSERPLSALASASTQSRYTKQTFLAEAEARPAKRAGIKAPNQRKRDLSGRANGTIDGWYGCYLYDEMLDYAINYTFPWSAFSSSMS